MESLLIINSTLVIICMYFIKDFHKEFKDLSKKVERLEIEMKVISVLMGVKDNSKKEEKN